MVVGDPAVDRYLVPTERKSSSEIRNFELQQGNSIHTMAGGSLMLAEMVEDAGRACKAGFGKPIQQNKDEVIEEICKTGVCHSKAESKVVHSLAKLEWCEEDLSRRNKVCRIDSFLGFEGPSSVDDIYLKVDDDILNVDSVIIDDSSNGYRDSVNAWPKVLKSKKKVKKPYIILKTNRPLGHGKLWDHIHANGFDKKLVLVVNIDDLRTEGMNVSKRMSWESTAIDFASQIGEKKEFGYLKECTYLVVRLSMDGCLLFHRDKTVEKLELFFDPRCSENDFFHDHPGLMMGLTNAFVASLVAEFHKGGYSESGLRLGIRRGLQSSRQLHRAGFSQKDGTLCYNFYNNFANLDRSKKFPGVNVPLVKSKDLNKPWRIFSEAHKGKTAGQEKALLANLAFEIVINGYTSGLMNAPMVQFGGLKTVTREEIESLHSVQNLMSEYLNAPKTTIPLSLAVFGPPGSGKSFGVKQLAKAIGIKSEHMLTFNISQFSGLKDLAAAFHRVRDIALTQEVPLVFFDEFDCNFNSKLGWLKNFLAPMNDGEFKDGEEMHPIGKSIFIFAGSTIHSYREFNELAIESRDPKIEDLCDTKLDDFISRLRGYIEIVGLDKPAGAAKNDFLHYIRRAILLRSIITRNFNQLVDGAGKVQIDGKVLAAFIQAEKYEHGVRSMQAILEMSRLSGKNKLEPSALPSNNQIAMHIDPVSFTEILDRDTVDLDQHEILEMAMGIHANYLKSTKNFPTGSSAATEWDSLKEEHKQSSLKFAEHIPAMLNIIGLNLHKVGKPTLNPIPEELVKYLAELEHERWFCERLDGGWNYTSGPRDNKKKLSPELIPWDEVKKETKKINIDMISGVPKLLQDVGFEISSK